MKKLFKIFIALVLMFYSFSAICGCGESDEKLYVYMPDGAPALAMSKLMYDNTNLGKDTEYTVVSSGNIGNCIIQKKADIAIVPVNMASKLIGNGEDYKIIATVTNGNLFIVGNTDIDRLDDLKGQVVGVIGEGNVPDLNLRYLLSSNSTHIEYEVSEKSVDNKVAIRYFSDASHLLPMLKQNKLNFGLLPEPAVSKLLAMASNFNVELDIQALWDGGSYPQAVVIAKNEICDDSSIINMLISKLEENESWILNNSEDAVKTINSHLAEGVTASLQPTISVTAIQNCNIDVKAMTTEEITRIKNYLDGIKTIETTAVGNYTNNMFYGL